MEEQYDFDLPEDFQGLLSTKWNFRAQMTGNPDVLPMWVADMDFQTARPIREALVRRAGRGIYGYAQVTPAYTGAVVRWFATEHDWVIEPGSLIQAPGVVTALHVLVGAFSGEGDGVVFNTPAYPPFFSIPRTMGRIALENPLLRTDQGYRLDFEALEGLFKARKPRLFILCNPHNPTGTVFSRDDLRQLADLCSRHQVMVLADEIHGDLVYPGRRHVPFGTLDRTGDFAACVAPSKTFNIAGLGNALTVIPDEDLRRLYVETAARFGIPGPNLFGLIAGEAAYASGKPWLIQVVAYLEANRDRAVAFMRERLPMLPVTRPQGTYFLWIDCRPLGLDDEALQRFLVHEAGLWLKEGRDFGSPGFARLNFACPASLLMRALDQLEVAIRKRRHEPQLRATGQGEAGLS